MSLSLRVSWSFISSFSLIVGWSVEVAGGTGLDALSGLLAGEGFLAGGAAVGTGVMGAQLGAVVVFCFPPGDFPVFFVGEALG